MFLRVTTNHFDWQNTQVYFHSINDLAFIF